MIHFKGSQWIVDDHGIDTVDGKYFIHKERLGELRPGRSQNNECSDWLIHLEEKGWVDIDDFISAFSFALAWHAGSYEHLSAAAFREGIREARAHQKKPKIKYPDRPISAAELARGDYG
jgi:hypothetical protein